MHARLLLWPMLLGCPSPEPTPEPEDLAATLLAAGPRAVGYQEQSLTYDPGDGERTLRLAVWYPTDGGTGQDVDYLGVFPAPGVLADAEPLSGPFPLVVFSHGFQGYAESSGRLVSQLVSHGTIVVAPDHPGSTFLDAGDRDASTYWHRPADIGAAIDHVLNGDFAARLTADPIVAIGHSFGGYTLHALGGASFDGQEVFDACRDGSDDSDFCSGMTPEQEARFADGLRDPRIAAAISMAPGDFRLFTASGLAAIEIPVLHMTGGLDDPDIDEPTWEALDRPGNTRVHLPSGGHNVFADAAPFLDTMEGVVDPEVAWPVIGAYWIAFVRAQHGDATVDGVLDGSLPLGANAEVTPGG